MVQIISKDTLKQLKQLLANENFVHGMNTESVKTWWQFISQGGQRYALNEEHSLFLREVIASKTRKPILAKILHANINSPMLFIVAEASVSLFDFLVRYFSTSPYEPAIEKPNNICLLLSELNLTADESKHIFDTLYQLYRLRQYDQEYQNTVLPRILAEIYLNDIKYKEQTIAKPTKFDENLKWIEYWQRPMQANATT